MKPSLPLLHAVRAKLQPRSSSAKLVRPAHPVINRPVSKVNAILIKASAKHPSLLVGEDQALGGTKVVDSFSQLYLRSDVVSALESIGVSQPTVIQMLAIPKISAGRNVLCAAETGSGKTLAYLAPLIHRLREEEERNGVVPRLKRPRSLILLPSRDLAAQVLSVAKSLCHVAKFRAVGLIGGIKRRFIKESLKNPVDVAVATPDSLLKFRREEQILLSDLHHIVIDEADTLFDPSFEDATTSILKSLQIRSKKASQTAPVVKGTQVTIVGATLSTKMLSKIEKLVPNIKKVSTKHLHQILPHIEQRFIKTRQDAKADKLLHLVQIRPSDVFVIFCNTVPGCDWTARFLMNNDIPVIKLHAGFSSQDRKNLLKRFIAEETRVLVCTDIASRGIDCSRISHVVSFDFPNSLPDYLHRVGRTGRVGMEGTKCKATTFMTHRRDVTLAWKVKDAATKREALMNRKVMKKLDKLEQISVSGRT